MSRIRRKDDVKMLTKLEAHLFNSVTRSIGFIGQTVSPVAIFFNSYLEQKKRGTKTQHIIKQNSVLKQLKQFEATRQYRSVQGQGFYSIYVVHFADAARPCEHGQLGYIGGLVIGEPIQESIFHSVD